MVKKWENAKCAGGCSESTYDFYEWSSKKGCKWRQWHKLSGASVDATPVVTVWDDSCPTMCWSLTWIFVDVCFAGEQWEPLHRYDCTMYMMNQTSSGEGPNTDSKKYKEWSDSESLWHQTSKRCEEFKFLPLQATSPNNAQFTASLPHLLYGGLRSWHRQIDLPKMYCVHYATCSQSFLWTCNI